MKHSAIRKRFEQHLRSKSLKFTSQRDRIFELAFNTHQHFTADTLHEWLKGQEGAPVSRATVYRTLHLLVEGGFIASVETSGFLFTEFEPLLLSASELSYSILLISYSILLQLSSLLPMQTMSTWSSLCP